jgi:hypothetical protein
MKPITKYYADVEYDAIENLLNKLKRDLRIREWVEMQDLYVDKKGDVYYVELYNYEYQREEGHGLHDVLTSVEPVDYKLLLTNEEAKVFVKDYVNNLEETEPHPIVWFAMFVLLSALAWLFLYVGQPQ